MEEVEEGLSSLCRKSSFLEYFFLSFCILAHGRVIFRVRVESVERAVRVCPIYNGQITWARLTSPHRLEA